MVSSTGSDGFVNASQTELNHVIQNTQGGYKVDVYPINLSGVTVNWPGDPTVRAMGFLIGYTVERPD